ncbi:MAG TPA: hypothetical protein VLG09_05400 [Candidatus Saccharimonadales bacterium]|nr:hypothetical protein [Candidatus Saccharimonadales bacterium]
MTNLKNIYRLSELPDNLMLSPKFLFDWWDGVIERFGGEVALTNKSPDFKLARELWVAAVFACCKRLSSQKEHWVSTVSDEAPDAWVAYFDIDNIGANRQIYQIEVTEYDNNAVSLEQVLKKKLDKAYHPTTRIVCYMTRTKSDFTVNLKELMEYVQINNPRNYEVWLLGGFTPKRDTAKNPQKLFCLTTGEDYQVDMAEEKLVPNTSEAVWVPTAKSINKKGELTPLGKITLEFPVIDPAP